MLPILVNVSIWMAGRAKIAAIYDSPFWRVPGLSGDGYSQRGPLMEVHDASPLHGGSGVLFGFVGVSAEQRAYRGEAVMKEAALEQLLRMFGAPAASPRDLYYHDWAFDRYCASARGSNSGGRPQLSPGFF